MVKYSVSFFVPSDNDVESLSNIIQCKLDYYDEHLSPFHEQYIHTLKTVAGLGYTAVLVKDYCRSIYQRHLNVFDNGGSVASSISHMIQLGLSAFRYFDNLPLPRYFEDFVDAIVKLLNTLNLQGILREIEEKEAKRMIALLEAMV